MNMLPDISLYSHDAKLSQRISAYVSTLCCVHTLRSYDEAIQRLAPHNSALVLVDMCADKASLLLQELKRNQLVVVVALGTPRTDPLLFAEALDVYATENSEIDRKRLQALVRRAIEYLDLVEENRSLKEELASSTSLAQISSFLSSHQSPKDLYYLRHFTRAFNNCNDRRALVESVIEGVTSSVGVARVGIFSYSKEFEHYELSADYKCLEQTSDLSFVEDDPFVQYLETSSHIVSQQGLNHIQNSQVRRMLRQNLDVFGAEVIVPLQMKSKLLGWLFLGPRITGQHFKDDELENLMIIGELISSLMYNSMLHEQFSIQGDLFDALINSISVGIVTISEDERVRFINSKALDILGLTSRYIVNQSAGKLGHLTGSLRAILHDPAPSAPFTFVSQKDSNKCTVYVQRLERQGKLLGALALLNDNESDGLLSEADSEPSKERAVLSPQLSHEIKNQLVAINTFIQLLPERYDDPEFREHFCEIATDEIARIKELISDESEEAFANHG